MKDIFVIIIKLTTLYFYTRHVSVTLIKYIYIAQINRQNISRKSFISNYVYLVPSTTIIPSITIIPSSTLVKIINTVHTLLDSDLYFTI